jgi:hypothetical protein
MIKRTARGLALVAATGALALAGTGTALASHGADDPAGHHRHHHHHHHHHHHGHHHHGPNHA